MTESAGLRERLITLRALREQNKAANRRPRGTGLTRTDRALVFQSTGGKCHICGGKIDGPWQADHIKAHSAGGTHVMDNYLPAHRTCNNYRWDYLAEEFEIILKLGVWARTQVEVGSEVGCAVEQEFSKYEARRIMRGKRSSVG